MSIVFPYIFCLHICTSVEYIIYFIQNLMVSLREGCKQYCLVSLLQWGKPPPHSQSEGFSLVAPRFPVYSISLYFLPAHLQLCWIYYLLHTKISWSTTQRAISNTDWWVWCSEKSPHTIWGPLIGGSNISVSSANRSLDCCQKHDDCMMTACLPPKGSWGKFKC